MLYDRARVLAAAERGDREAFLALCDRFAPQLYRFLYRLTGSEAGANRLTVAAFARAFASLRSRPRDMVLDTWFYRMAAAAFSSAVRWRALRPLPPLDTVEGRAGEWLQATLALPPRLRLVWVLTLAEGLPLSQAAEVLKTSPAAIQDLLERAHTLFVPPEPVGDRQAVERALRKLPVAQPPARVRSDLVRALAAGQAALRTRLVQSSVAALVLVLLVVAGFSLLREGEAAGADPLAKQADDQLIAVLVEGSSGALLLVDPKRNEVTNTVAVGPQPRAMASAGQGRQLYVLQQDGIATVDLGAQRVVNLLRLSGSGWATLAFAGNRLYIGSQEQPQVLVADPKKNQVLATVTLPWPVKALLSLGTQGVVAVARDVPEVALVSPDAATAGQPVRIGDATPLGATVANAAEGIVYVTKPRRQEIWRVRMATGEAERLARGQAALAQGGLLSADGAVLYLSYVPAPPPADILSSVPVRSTQSQSDTPTVFALQTSDGTEVGRLGQREGVHSLALSGDGRSLYALVPAGHTLLVVDSRSLAVRTAIPLGLRPLAAATVPRA
jgi:DNA-directed RNA polymerase specialized sigma24 family protein/DNA-binding beta-propeller fold protein YncE